MKKDLSLKRQIFILTSVISMIPLMIFLGISVIRSSDALTMTIAKGLQSESVLVANDIDGFIAQRVTDVKVLSQADVLEGDDIEKIIRYLTEVVKENGWIDDIDIIDLKGIVIASSGEQNEKGRLITELYGGLEDISRKAMNAKQGDVYVSEAQLLDTGPGLLFVTPITDESNENVIKVVLMEVNLEKIAEIVHSFDDTIIGEKYVYLVDNHGRVIISRDPAVSFYDDFADITVHPELLDKFEKQGDVGHVIYKDFYGDMVMAGYSDMAEFGINKALDWSIIAIAPLNEIILPAIKTRNILILVGIFITFLAVLMGYFYSLKITNSLNKTVEIVKNIQDGDLTEQLPVEGALEIQILSRTFNDMSKKLAATLEELKIKARSLTENMEVAEKKNVTLLRTKAIMAGMMKELRQEQLKLEESEIRIRTIVETTVDGMIVIDEKGIVSMFNPAAENLFNYEAGEVIGQNIKMFMPEPDHSQHDGYLKHYQETGEKKVIGIGREVEGKRKNGETFPMDLAVSEMRLGDKRMFTGIVRDITERKQAEEALLESREYARSIIETANQAFIGIDLDGVVTDWNKRAEDIFGWTREEAIGKSLSETIIPVSSRDAHKKGIQHFCATGEGPLLNKTVEFQALHHNGHEFSVEITIWHHAMGQQKRFYAFVSDITERKRAQEEILRQKEVTEKVNLELDSFVYTASHDLRAPLRGISSFATFLEEDYKDKIDEEGRDYITEIRKGTERMSLLIEDLLALSRISRIENPYEDVGVGDIINTVTDRINHDIQETKTQLVVQKDMPVIHCDRIKITEVFANLINNAIKFSSKGEKDRPKVEVGYTKSNGLHEFFVKDNGIGIAPEYHEKIFGIFKRLHTENEYEGTGAGLSIVQKIIETHKGKIWIESEPGQGATFRFTIAGDLEGKKQKGHADDREPECSTG